MPLTNDQISEQAKIAQESKYAGLWSQFQTFYADNTNKAYGQEYFLERQNYGQIKAYMERRNFEQNLYSLNATYEEVAILRAMDQNYDLIAANPGIARSPEFVNQAIGEYVTDETAFSHYMSNYNQAAQENNYGLLKKLEALNNHLDTEEKVEDYYNQLGDAGKKQLALADINDMDEWKEAFDYFAAKSADEERKSNSNWWTYSRDLVLGFLSGAVSSFGDVIISMLDAVPTILNLFPGIDREGDGWFNNIIGGWMDVGDVLRQGKDWAVQGAVGGIKGVTGGEADHGGGFAGGVMSFAEGLGSAVGIVASLYFTAGLGAKGVMGKGAAALGKAGKAGAAASKTLSITGKAGKFVLGAPLKATGYIGQGVGLVYKGAGAALKSVGFTKTGTLIAGKTGMAGWYAKGKSAGLLAISQAKSVYDKGLAEGFDEHTLRTAYATTAIANVVLLAGLTGAMPGGEVSGGHALKSPTRIKQLLLAGTYEGIEENMQQSIEQGAVKFAGDKNFFDLFTNAWSTETFIQSFAIGATLGMGHHYTSNRAAGSQAAAEYKAIDSTYKELTENNNIDTTYLERTFAEMKQNPAKFNLPTDGSFSDTNFRDAALKYTIDNGGGTIRQFFENKILGNYMTEYIVQEATIAETSMNATEAAWKQIMQEAEVMAQDTKETITAKDQENIETVIRTFGIPTSDTIILNTQPGYLAPYQFKTLLSLNDITKQQTYMEMDTTDQASFIGLSQKEVNALFNYIENSPQNSLDTTALNVVREHSDITGIDILQLSKVYNIDIGKLNESYGKYNSISQWNYNQFKDNYNNSIINLKQSIAENNVSEIIKYRDALNSSQVDALSKVVDGVSLTPLEIKTLYNNGFDIISPIMKSPIEVANAIERIAEAIAAADPNQKGQTIDEVVKKTYGNRNNIDIAEIRKYLANPADARLLTDRTIEYNAMMDEINKKRDAELAELKHKNEIGDITKAIDKQQTELQKSKDAVKKQKKILADIQNEQARAKAIDGKDNTSKPAVPKTQKAKNDIILSEAKKKIDNIRNKSKVATEEINTTPIAKDVKIKKEIKKTVEKAAKPDINLNKEFQEKIKQENMAEVVKLLDRNTLIKDIIEKNQNNVITETEAMEKRYQKNLMDVNQLKKLNTEQNVPLDAIVHKDFNPPRIAVMRHPNLTDSSTLADAIALNDDAAKRVMDFDKADIKKLKDDIKKFKEEVTKNNRMIKELNSKSKSIAQMSAQDILELSQEAVENIVKNESTRIKTEKGKVAAKNKLIKDTIVNNINNNLEATKTLYENIAEKEVANKYISNFEANVQFVDDSGIKKNAVLQLQTKKGQSMTFMLNPDGHMAVFDFINNNVNEQLINVQDLGLMDAESVLILQENLEQFETLNAEMEVIQESLLDKDFNKLSEKDQNRYIDQLAAVEQILEVKQKLHEMQKEKVVAQSPSRIAKNLENLDIFKNDFVEKSTEKELQEQLEKIEKEEELDTFCWKG